jgi:hypothetical protein
MSNQLTVNQLKKLQLEDIIQRKREIRTEIGLQKDVIVYSAKRLVSFSSGTTPGGGIFKKFGTGMAVFDGILIGYKMIKRVKKLFRRK